MELAVGNAQWDQVVALSTAVFVSAYGLAKSLGALRPDRLRRHGIDDGNTLLLQLWVVALTALCFGLSITDTMGDRLPVAVYFALPILASGLVISSMIGQLAERPKFWRMDESKTKRVSLKWKSVREIIVGPVLAPFVPLATTALRQAPELLK